MNDENQTMIRFIDSSYRTLFFIPDGGTIIVTRSDGGKVKRACTFLDEYHTRVGRETYHICQFAKLGTPTPRSSCLSCRPSVFLSCPPPERSSALKKANRAMRNAASPQMIRRQTAGKRTA